VATDLLSIDKKLALAARALDAWRAELASSGRGDRDDPIATWRELITRDAVRNVAASTLAPIASTPALLLPGGEAKGPELTAFEDPLVELRAGAVAWCAHLHVADGVRDATAERAAAARDDLESDSYGRAISLRAMLRSLARPKQAGGVPEPRAAAAIEDLAPQLLDPLHEEESRRRETAETLGAHAACCLAPDADAAARAEALLAATEDEARDAMAWGLRAIGRNVKGATWVDAFAVRRATDVAEGWPATLSPRWLAELARGTPLLSGLNIDARVDAARLVPRADLASLRLAPATGAWTFAHALYALGCALRLHGRDARAPFVTHTRPHDVRPYELGEAFLALVAQKSFHARARGVAAAKADASARRLHATRLFERRQLALRVRLAPELAKGKRAFKEAFETLAPAALVAEVPVELATLLGAPGPLGPAEDAARLAAIDKGEALSRELTERFDLDWWRNPKSAEWIRDRCAR
jgi:hypothetical protein